MTGAMRDNAGGGSWNRFVSTLYCKTLLTLGAESNEVSILMKTKLSALTSLRFFAALMVFFSHLSFLVQSDSPVVARFFNEVMYEGYIGVTFFFVLSGFILSYAHHGRCSGYRAYMLSRLARIYPLHALTLLFAIPLFLVIREFPTDLGKYFSALAYNATLTQALNSSSSYYFSFNAPSWSLSVELFFYALFPLVTGLRTKVVLVIAFSIITLKVALVEFVKPSSVHYLFYICPPLRLADFLIGMLLFRFYLVMPTPHARSATLLQCGSLMLLAAFLYFGRYVSQAHRFDVYYVVPMALVIFAFAFQSGALARAISGRLLMLWGEASFAFYLVHQLIITAGQDIRLRIGSNHALSTDIGYAIMYLLIALAISVLLFKYYESPARAKMLSLMGTRRRAFVG